MPSLLAYIQPAVVLYDLSKDGIMVTGLDGKISYTNPAIRELFGYSVEQVNGRFCTDLRHDPNFRFDKLLSELSAHDNIIRVINCSGNNGKNFTVTVNYTLLHNLNNEPIGVLFVFKEKIGLEEERMQHFHHQINLLKALGDRTDELITVTNVQARTTLYVSDALEKIIGWDPQKFLENGWALGISLTHPEDVKRLVEEFLKGIGLWNSEPFIHDHKPIVYEFRWRHRNGSWRWLHGESFVLERDEKDQVLFTIVFTRDVTDEKSVDKQLTEKILNQLLKQNNIDSPTESEQIPSSTVFGISLSPREIQLLRHIRMGHSAKDISRILGLRLNTINSYKKNLFKKLDARNAADAIRIATEWGLE